MAGPTGVEPATPGLKVRCSILTEPRAHALTVADSKSEKGFFSVSVPVGELTNGDRPLDVFLDLQVIFTNALKRKQNDSFQK